MVRDGCVHVWWFALTSPVSDADTLSSDETARAGRFRSESDRARWRAARNGLRRVLSLYVPAAPSEIRFNYTSSGKPSVSREDAGGPFHFSLTHSADIAAVAVAGRPVGIDLEFPRPVPDALALACRYFASEECEILSQCTEESLEPTFYRLWTRKEAVLKATGCGLSGLRSVNVVQDRGKDSLDDQQMDWTLRSFSLHSAVGAVALLGTIDQPFRLTFQKLDDGVGQSRDRTVDNVHVGADAIQRIELRPACVSGPLAPRRIREELGDVSPRSASQ
jgi:4'-phosphopantetheinyl transferase